MKIDYLLTGTMSDGYLEVHGHGELDNTTGTYGMQLDVRHRTDGWDPIIIPTICCDSLTYLSAKLKREGLQRSRSILSAYSNGLGGGGRGGVIGLLNGRPVLNIRAKGYVFIKDGCVFTRTVVLEGTSKLNEFSGVKRVLSYSETIQNSIPLNASGNSNFTLEMNDGTTLYGARMFPYVFDAPQDLQPALTLNVEIDSTGLANYYSGKTNLHFSSKVNER
jgi:hypothetical protein